MQNGITNKIVFSLQGSPKGNEMHTTVPKLSHWNIEAISDVQSQGLKSKEQALFLWFPSVSSTQLPHTYPGA
jgi:hypothetical protein